MKIAAFYENVLEGAESNNISVKDALGELQRCGLELLYLSMASLHEREEEIIDLLRDLKLGLEGIYGFYDFGHCPDDDSWREMIDSARRLGASNVLIVPGMVPAEEKSESEPLIRNMKTVLARAVSYGQEAGVAVSMEDFDGLEAPFCTIAGLKDFLDDVPGLECSFDTGNFVMYHENELEGFQLFRDKICTVHLKDRRKEARFPDDSSKICADGSFCYPAETGEGYIHIKEILSRLREQNYPGNVIVELYDYSPQHMLEGLRESVNWVRETLKAGTQDTNEIQESIK